MRGTCRGRPAAPLRASPFEDLLAAAHSWHKARAETQRAGHAKDPRSGSGTNVLVHCSGANEKS